MPMLVAALLVGLSTAAAGQAVSPELPTLIARVERYLPLVRQHRTDAYDDALRQIAQWPRGDLEAAVDAWRRLIVDAHLGFGAIAHQQSTLLDIAELPNFHSAMLMHTVAGILAFDHGERQVLLFHLDMASRLKSARDATVKADVSREREAKNQQARTFDRHWEWAVSTFYHGRRALTDAHAYMDRALLLAPPDAEILLAAGRIFEALHQDRTSQFAVLHQPGTTQSVRTVKEQMLARAAIDADARQAETLYREALVAGGDPAVVNLRLGRLLQVSSRQAEAAERLGLALTATSDPPTRYLAHLFLGRLAEDRNDPANAIANYDAAIQACPLNQNARIAKARLLAASGRRSEASDITLAALTIVRSEADEPWWIYYHPDEDALSRLVMRLRGYIQ